MNKNLQFFYFKIKENSLDQKVEISNGITVGESYADAVKHLEDYYCSDLDEILSLVAIGNDSVLCNCDFDIKQEEMKEVFDSLYKNKDFYTW